MNVNEKAYTATLKIRLIEMGYDDFFGMKFSNICPSL